MTQLTLDQLRSFGLTPDTNLGQHFLIDNNILNVIERMSLLKETDICYEPGVGVGVLTDFLARRVNHVHGVETDHRLEKAINAMQSDLNNVTIHWNDATKIDTSTLDPLPNKLVSNLPYHVAAPIIAEALKESPSIKHYCVMIQQEVGERLFASESTKSYNALSVLVRATCTRTDLHKVSRKIFLPPPNVDSVLIAFARDKNLLRDDEVRDFYSFVRNSFHLRRKTLANNLNKSLSIAREHTATILGQLDLQPLVRPEQLDPNQFIYLFRAFHTNERSPNNS